MHSGIYVVTKGEMLAQAGPSRYWILVHDRLDFVVPNRGQRVPTALPHQVMNPLLMPLIAKASSHDFADVAASN